MKELVDVWPGLPDWQWTARFVYQVIERRGTGGGGFRLMYADFLKEAEVYCPEISVLGLCENMRQIGNAWTDLSLALKAASESPRTDFNTVLDRIREVHRLEAAYHRVAKSLA